MSRANKPPFPYSAKHHRDGGSLRRGSRPHAVHDENPAGSKLVRRMYKKASGVKKSRRATLTHAVAWHNALVEKHPTMPYPLGDCRNPRRYT